MWIPFWIRINSNVSLIFTLPTALPYKKASPFRPTLCVVIVGQSAHPCLCILCISWMCWMSRCCYESLRIQSGNHVYRGCWHRVSRGFLLESCHNRILDDRVLRAKLPFFTHAISLDQAFAHCPKFPTAASRRSLGRVSVPVWLIIRKDQLSIIGLVSLYHTNYLILRGLIIQRWCALIIRNCSVLFGRFPRVTHPFATLRCDAYGARIMSQRSTCMC